MVWISGGTASLPIGGRVPKLLIIAVGFFVSLVFALASPAAADEFDPFSNSFVSDAGDVAGDLGTLVPIGLKAFEIGANEGGKAFVASVRNAVATSFLAKAWNPFAALLDSVADIHDVIHSTNWREAVAQTAGAATRFFLSWGSGFACGVAGKAILGGMAATGVGALPALAVGGLVYVTCDMAADGLADLAVAGVEAGVARVVGGPGRGQNGGGGPGLGVAGGTGRMSAGGTKIVVRTGDITNSARGAGASASIEAGVVMDGGKVNAHTGNMTATARTGERARIVVGKAGKGGQARASIGDVVAGGNSDVQIGVANGGSASAIVRGDVVSDGRRGSASTRIGVDGSAFIGGDVINKKGALSIGSSACAGTRDGRCCLKFHRGYCAIQITPPGKHGCPPRFELWGGLCYLYSDKRHRVGSGLW